MKSVTSGFLSAVKNGTKPSWRATIIFADGSQEVISDDGFAQGSIVYRAGTCASGSFGPGGCVISSFSFGIQDWAGNFKSKTWRGARVVAQCGFWVDSVMEYVSLGTFYVVSHKTSGNVLTVEAYDALKFLDQENYTPNLPATARTIVQECISGSGLTLGTSSFKGYNFRFEEWPEGAGPYTKRQALAYVMQALCLYARVSGSNSLLIDWYTPVSDSAHALSGTWKQSVETAPVTITGSHLYPYGYSEDEGGDVTVGSEGYMIGIKDNPFINASNISALAAYHNTNIVGTSWLPGDLSVLTNPAVEAGDVLYTTEGYLFPVTNLTLKSQLRESITSDVVEEDPESDLRKTGVNNYAELVKKYTEDYISDWEAMALKISQLVAEGMGAFITEEDAPSGSGKIYYMHNKPTLEESDIVWRMSGNVFSVSTDGGKTWNAGITAEGEALVNLISTIGITFDWAKGGTLSLGGVSNGNGVLRCYDAAGNLITQIDLGGITTNRLEASDYIKVIGGAESIIKIPINWTVDEEKYEGYTQIDRDGFVVRDDTYTKKEVKMSPSDGLVFKSLKEGSDAWALIQKGIRVGEDETAELFYLQLREEDGKHYAFLSPQRLVMGSDDAERVYITPASVALYAEDGTNAIRLNLQGMSAKGLINLAGESGSVIKFAVDDTTYTHLGCYALSVKYGSNEGYYGSDDVHVTNGNSTSRMTPYGISSPSANISGDASIGGNLQVTTINGKVPDWDSGGGGGGGGDSGSSSIIAQGVMTLSKTDSPYGSGGSYFTGYSQISLPSSFQVLVSVHGMLGGVGPLAFTTQYMRGYLSIYGFPVLSEAFAQSNYPDEMTVRYTVIEWSQP